MIPILFSLKSYVLRKIGSSIFKFFRPEDKIADLAFFISLFMQGEFIAGKVARNIFLSNAIVKERKAGIANEGFTNLLR